MTMSMDNRSRSQAARMTVVCVGWEVSLIERFISHVTIEYRRELERLNVLSSEEAKKQEDDDSEWDGMQYQNDFCDEYCTLEDIRSLADQLAIVALYRTVELRTKELLRLLDTEKEIEKRNLYRSDKFKKALARHKINVEDITNYKAIDELRCLNNAIKHENKVS